MAAKEYFPLESVHSKSYKVLYCSMIITQKNTLSRSQVEFLDSNTDVQLLPSSNTKARVHLVCEQAAVSAGVTAVSYPKFVEMWNNLRPQMRITKPMTDFMPHVSKE